MEDSNIGKEIRKFVIKYGLDNGMEKVVVKKIWEQELGQLIKNNTISFDYNKATIYVKLESSVLKHELTSRKTKLIELINKKIGKNLVVDIKIT